MAAPSAIVSEPTKLVEAATNEINVVKAAKPSAKKARALVPRATIEANKSKKPIMSTIKSVAKATISTASETLKAAPPMINEVNAVAPKRDVVTEKVTKI